MHKWSLLLNKAELRKTLLDKRARVSGVARDSYSHLAKKIFLENNLFSSHTHFACYLATSHEFDCKPIIEAIWSLNKKCYLPMISEKNDLQFATYFPETKLKGNRYQILEPADPDFFPKEKIDVVFLPLVGFDLQGNRLGMGKGYYDKTFSSLTKKPILIGLAYDFQKVEKIPKDDWDVQLDGVLTEKTFLFF